MDQDIEYYRSWFEKHRKRGLVPCVYSYCSKIMWEMRPKSQVVDTGERIRLHGVLQKKYVLRDDRVPDFAKDGGNHEL